MSRYKETPTYLCTCKHLPGIVPKEMKHKRACFRAMFREAEGWLSREATAGRRRLASSSRRLGSLTMTA